MSIDLSVAKVGDEVVLDNGRKMSVYSITPVVGAHSTEYTVELRVVQTMKGVYNQSGRSSTGEFNEHISKFNGRRKD